MLAAIWWNLKPRDEFINITQSICTSLAVVIDILAQGFMPQNKKHSFLLVPSLLHGYTRGKIYGVGISFETILAANSIKDVWSFYFAIVVRCCVEDRYAYIIQNVFSPRPTLCLHFNSLRAILSKMVIPLPI